jgi:hypothetical protein
LATLAVQQKSQTVHKSAVLPPSNVVKPREAHHSQPRKMFQSK